MPTLLKNWNKKLEPIPTDHLNNVKTLAIAPLISPLIPAAVALDQQCLGGMWAADGYQREIDSPNSVMLVAFEPSFEPRFEPRFEPHLDALASPLLALACLWTVLDEAHITILAVHPDYRGQGLGYLMVTALMQAAWQREMEWVTLEVRVSNTAAIALYRQFDFADVGQRKRYYQNPEENALILWRKGLKQAQFPVDLRCWWQQAGDRLHHAGWQASSLNPSQAFPTLPLDLAS